MTMGKYGEPWKPSAFFGNTCIDSKQNELVVYEGTVVDLKHIERIVACVNACEGIEKPEKIKEILDRCFILAGDIGCATLMDDIKELLGDDQ